MIKLLIKKLGQYFIITIDARVIKYWDAKMGEVWKTSVQYLPPSPAEARKIDMSRNRIPQIVKELLVVTKEEMAEFTNAKTDEELKEIVLRDCKKNGCQIIKIE